MYFSIKILSSGKVEDLMSDFTQEFLVVVVVVVVIWGVLFFFFFLKFEEVSWALQ